MLHRCTHPNTELWHFHETYRQLVIQYSCVSKVLMDVIKLSGIKEKGWSTSAVDKSKRQLLQDWQRGNSDSALSTALLFLSGSVGGQLCYSTWLHNTELMLRRFISNLILENVLVYLIQKQLFRPASLVKLFHLIALGTQIGKFSSHSCCILISVDSVIFWHKQQ